MGRDPRVGQVMAVLELAHADPELARRRALGFLTETVDGEVRSIAERVMGLAAKELGRLEDADTHLRRAIDLAMAHRLEKRAAEARMSHSLVLLELGNTREALAEVVRARGVLRGHDAGILEMQRALIFQRMGRLDDALTGYRRALVVLRRHGDRIRETRLRLNRAAVNTYRGALVTAETDLAAARDLARSLGQRLLEGGAAHNLGFLYARRGEIQAAILAYEEAEAAYRQMGAGRLMGVLAGDRAELLLAVGLGSEARRHAEAAVAAAERSNNAVDATEAMLLVADSQLATGESDLARRTAEEAARRFTRQRRHAWAAYSRYVALHALVVDTQDLPRRPTKALQIRAGRVAVELEREGWRPQARSARLIEGRIALRRGEIEEARTQLQRLVPVPPTASVASRVEGWHAAGLLRSTEGDRVGARRSLRAGLRLLEQFRATLGAQDLRASVSALSAGLARTGLRLGLEEGNPRQVLFWSEAARAAALTYPAARPPRSRRAGRLLARLRAVEDDLRDAVLQGADALRLESERARLERAIRDSARQAAGSSKGQEVDFWPMLREALGDAVLVSYFQHRGSLGAVRMHAGRASIVELVTLDRLEAEIAPLLFALHHLATLGAAQAVGQAVTASYRHAVRTVSDLVIGPLRLPDAASTLLAPTGTLFRLPWMALPALAQRPTKVVPSIRGWLRPSRRRSGPADLSAVLVAGPGLPGAKAEVAALSRLYRGRLQLTGRQATVKRVLEALEGADLAHLAAHGSLRTDNPLFSNLLLADGALTVYDLDRLRRPPHTVVMPACSGAANTVWTGDELLGLSAAFLQMGVSSLIAPVVTIPDDATKDLMVAVHKRLRAGMSPDAALADAIAGAADPSPRGVAVKGAFICLGA